MIEDLPEGAERTLNLVFKLHTGDEQVDEAAERLRHDRESVKRAQLDLARRTEQLVVDLTSRLAMSVRDAATLTGVSPQRVSQLASGAKQLCEEPSPVPPAPTSARYRRATGQRMTSAAKAKAKRAAARRARKATS